MTDLRQAAQQALEALELSAVTVDSFGVQKATQDAITALRTALEQQQAKPVAYDKTELNSFVIDLYDRKMKEGKHGHYETMFHVVHQALEQSESSAQRTLRQLGYTDCGGEFWKPPLGKAAQPEQQAEPVAVKRWLWIFEDRHGDRYTHKNLFYTADEAAESARICGVRAIKKIDSSPVPVQHTHQWFSTGAMEPGQMRCIDCGVWGRDVSLSGQPQRYTTSRSNHD